MKNDLTCEVVQDLLPSYVDHLTSDVTNTAIETHIRECADCRRILSDMQTPEPVPVETATDASTIDFLKKSNKRNKRRILAAILIVTLLLGSIWGYRTYFYPAPLKNTALIDYAVTVKDNKTIQIKGSLTDQTLGVAGIDYSCNPDHPETVTINIKTNRISAAGHNTFSDKKTETHAVKKVYVNDQIAWEDGTSILPKAAQIYATIHPYIGDMSANEKTLAALGISNVFSIANFKLQTTETPYGWTIYLDDAFTKKQQTTVEKTMKNYAMVILACTKNLGSVTFSYILDGKTTDFTYTKEQGENEFLGTCNYFRSSATEFQTLLAKTGILSDPVFSRLSGNQGYRLTEQLNNVPDTEITGTIQNEKQNIIKQYESYLPTNSWSPGSISKSFSSEKDALAYIGYKNLRSFALPQKADSISVNATADKKGNICYISLSELYSCADGQINVTAAADLYTESSNIGSYIDMDYPSYEETPDAVSTNELYTTASGDTWQLITTTSQGDDFNDSIDAYRTEDTILYGIHIGYPSNLKESAQAIWDWLKGFFDWFGDKITWAKNLWNGVKNFFTGGNDDGSDDSDGGDSSDKNPSGFSGMGGGKPSGGSGRTSSGNSPTGVQTSSGSTAASRNAASAFISGGRPVSTTTASQRPIAQTTNTKNITVKQENRQSYTFQVSDRNAASKLQSTVSSQSSQSTKDLAHALNYGR